MENIARQTIEATSLQESEVRDAAGVWYLLRSRPYKTSENKIEGAVISFQDIDALKRVVEDTRARLRISKCWRYPYGCEYHYGGKAER